MVLYSVTGCMVRVNKEQTNKSFIFAFVVVDVQISKRSMPIARLLDTFLVLLFCFENSDFNTSICLRVSGVRVCLVLCLEKRTTF